MAQLPGYFRAILHRNSPKLTECNKTGKWMVIHTGKAFPGSCWGIRAFTVPAQFQWRKQEWDISRAPYLSDSKSVCSSNNTIWRFSLCLRTSLVGFQNTSTFPFFISFICTSPSWEEKHSEMVKDSQKHKAENNPDKRKLNPDDGQG